MNKEQTSIYRLAKDIVDYAYADNLNMKDFILTFFRSDTLMAIICFSEIVYYNPLKTYKRFINKYSFYKEDKKKELDIDIIHYICYIYMTFYFRTNESFKMIVKELPFDDIIKYYELYHTLADERVIFKAKLNYNSKMNPIRKSRSTGYRFDLSNDKINLFIAKQLYLKLFDYPEINELKYAYSNGIYYLTSNNANLFVSDLFNAEKIIESSEASYIKYNCPNNILLVLLKDGENITQGELQRLFNNQPQIPFDKIIVYKDEKIDFINKGDGYKRFNIFITALDIKKIKNDYSKMLENN